VRAFCTRLQPGPTARGEIELTDAGTARPEEVATAVAATIGATPDHHPARAHEIVLRDAAVGAPT
jgi:hypothetical protein